MHIASLYLWNHKPYKISAWPTVVDVHITRKDTDFNCSQSLTCVEREFKRTYDLKIYSSVVILCKTNTASSFGPAIAWKWRQIFSETSVTFTIRRGATSKKTWVFIYTAVKNPTLAVYLLLSSFFRILHSLCWWLFTDVSRQHVGPIFKDQIVQEEFRSVSSVCGL